MSMQQTHYIRVAGCIEGRHRSYAGESAYIRVSSIQELCEVEGEHRLFETISEQEYNALPPEEQTGWTRERSQYKRYLVTTELVFDFVEGQYGVMRVIFLAAESTESLKARIDAVEFPPAHDDATLTLPVKGVWTPLEIYAKDDVVQHPAHPERFLLSLRENQSSTVPDKDGDIGWCLLPLQSEAAT